MGEINWGLAQGPNAADRAFERSYRTGMQMGEALKQGQMNNALAAYAMNQPKPGIVATPEQQAASDAAWQRLAKLHPAVAMKLQDQERERAFGDATAQFYGQNAFGSVRPKAPVNAMTTLSPSGLPAVKPGASFEEAFAPLGQQHQPAAAPVARPSGDQQPDLSFLGKPQTQQDQAFMRMMAIDPVRAMKIQSSMRDTFLGRLEGEHKFYSIAVDELSRMQDDAGWQRALGRLQPYANAMGVDLGETIPLNYPGPDAVDGLLQRALPVKERLDHAARMFNMQADNARADRNTDSLIATREGRLGEQRRYNAQRIETTQRGQDMTNARARAVGGRRGGGSAQRRGLGTASNPQPVQTATEATALTPGTYYKTPDGRVKIR